MRILAVIGALAIVVAVAAGVFFLGGFFDVGASWDDPALVRWGLVQTRQASINHQSGSIGAPPVKLDDPAVVRDGANEYAEHGCVNCHGGPGAQWAKFSEGLNPDPPELKEVAGLEPQKLFWVIKNGIRMTGMPSFGKAGAKDDDIWKIVAFVKKLPTVTEADYKSWTAPPAPAAAPAPAAPPPAAAAPEPSPAPAPANPPEQPR
jgi:cytochrome c553